jgi:hypothetical protein
MRARSEERCPLALVVAGLVRVDVGGLERRPTASSTRSENVNAARAECYIPPFTLVVLGSQNTNGEPW